MKYGRWLTAQNLLNPASEFDMIFIRSSRPDTRIVRWTGFTFTELMIVLAIIGLLAVIATPAFVRARDNSRLGGNDTSDLSPYFHRG